MKRLFMVASILLAAGCGKQATKPAPAPVESTSAGVGDKLRALPAIQVAGDTNQVLVTVGGHTLTRARMDQDIDIQLSAVRDRLPADQVDAFRAAAAGRLIEQFVIQTLLMDEAVRRNIAVTPEEEQRALAGLGERLKGQGRDLDEALSKSPMGRERLLSELRTGLTIDKLLAEVLPQTLEPTAEEIERFSKENADRLQRPERVHARRVLMAVDTNATEDVRAARKDALEKLREALANGSAEFGDVARTHSDCPSSARGGDLGWIQRGRMGAEFDNVAFTLPTGAVSPIVESPAGFEIITIEEHEDAQELPRTDIAELVKRRSRQAGLRELVKSMLAQNPVDYAPSVSNLVPDSLLGGI